MKLAILGAGMIVKDFLTMVGAIPEIELKAIVGTTRSIENLQNLKENYGIEAMYTDFDHCLTDNSFDTVYVALPNHLHYAYAKKALEYGKNVICEKPFTLRLSELVELKEIAHANDLILIEAVTNQYLANYQAVKDALPKLGELKIIECNYSQYSSRYDAFKEGTILPAFDPKKGGGALMDINIYNIHFVVGLLGMPESVQYKANVERGIDTSGLLFLNYPNTKVVCIGAKDSASAIRSTIQGNQGSMIINGPTSIINQVELQVNKSEAQVIDQKLGEHRLYEEFWIFNQVIAAHDTKFAERRLEHSLKVMEVVELALEDAGIQLG
ncbi:Gfo/Idh/MocA family oxidoreductase [Enterococcus sp. BWT-B8]|uniref:Gfo/Idh/MocA family protein n=1 Tax=Enterococcus sp. BWT-B8 TaxID=2885157 RepID=UPI001E3C8BFF|nr:Gfo/Idh/MocA family oxidoreductase [Enterococcus sp. BWT-B8]MCB5950889.1 Gfo/Idh/MocA family oxidoreductase [Enterococcus sp. BWT-B8]